MTESAFDLLADSYDYSFTHSFVGRQQRAGVWKVLSQFNFQNKKVVELNCGTGEDLTYLLSKGARIIASDLSLRMLQIAQNKEKSNAVCFLKYDMRDKWPTEFHNADFVFSNFGGINCICEKDLINLVRSCYETQNAEGRLVFVIMGRKCFIERLYFKFKNDARKNRRKVLDGYPTQIHGNTFLTYYYSPKEVEVLVSNYYECESLKPIGLFIPPSFLSKWVEKRKLIQLMVKILEMVCSSFSFLSNRSDHFIIVLKRKE